MTFLAATPQSSRQAAQSIALTPSDPEGLQPAWWEGSLDATGVALGRVLGVGSRIAGEAEYQAAGILTRPIDYLFGSDITGYLDDELRRKTAEATAAMVPDPYTTGTLGQVLYGIVGVGVPAAVGGYLGGPAGAAIGAGGFQGVGTYTDLTQQGVDPTTAANVAALAGGLTAVGVGAPAAVGRSVLFNTLAFGPASNVAQSLVASQGTAAILDARGYGELADRYGEVTAESLAADSILGAAFGWAGARGNARARMTPTVSDVDAALGALGRKHAEIDTAPGLPADVAALQSHARNLRSATESLLVGEPVRVETDGTFVPRHGVGEGDSVVLQAMKDAGIPEIMDDIKALEVELAKRGRVVDGEPLPAIEAPSGTPIGFKTAKGSTYALGENGVTTRNKAYRPEHGVKEQGPQPASEVTFYVTEEDAQKLGEFQARGYSRKIVFDGENAGVMYLEGKDSGKIEKRTFVKAHKSPEVGMIPVELWKNGKVAHFGNSIVEVEYSKKTAQAERRGDAGEVARLNDLRAQWKAGKLPPERFWELQDLETRDRLAAKVAGRRIPGVQNMEAYREAESAGMLLETKGFADADNFKAVNDELGHNVGDQAITMLGRTLSEELGPGRVFHRGGDEFIMQAETPEELHAAMDRARARLEQAELIATRQDGTTVSRKGLRFSYGEGKTPEEAESAQYRDKQARKAAGLRTDRNEPSPNPVGGGEGLGDQGAADRANRAENTAEAMTREAVDTHPDMPVVDENGGVTTAADMLKAADAIVAKADADSASFAAAVSCFLRNGG